jgi:putative transposase
VLQQVTLRLDKTYKSFFQRGFGFPKFRSCRNFFSICYPQSGFSIQTNVFHTKVYGDIKFVKHRNIKGTVKMVTIKCKGGKWFISVVTDFIKTKISIEPVVGIDVGITNLAALSTGEIIKNKTHAKYFDNQINKLKSRRNKHQKKSNKTRHLSKVIQRLYDVKNRKISDFQHKVSHHLSSTYDTIIMEDLNLKKMSEGEITGLNRELRNSQLGSFTSMLAYKSNRLLKVNPYNTSKTCNKCGELQDTPLNKREYVCKCGNKDDRDVNASKNILCLGQAIILGLCTTKATLQEALSFR